MIHRNLFLGLAILCIISLILFIVNTVTYGKLFGNDLIMNIVGVVLSVVGIITFIRINDSIPNSSKLL